MEYIINVFYWIESHINTIITIGGLLLAWYTYCREVKNSLIVKLARQVIAYYSLEQEAVKEIQAKTNENAKTIKIRLREAAKKSKENLESEYPSMTAKAARKHVC